MSDDTRYAAMVEFVGSFTTVSQAPEEISDLSDGVAIFEALSEIAPDYFEPTTIARHLGDNWVLKSSNLRKLVRNLQHYFNEDLGKDADFDNIDQNSIARQSDPEAVAGLIELVAAAAITCPSKADYIGRIMQMSAESQAAMKGVIESSMARLMEFTDDVEAGEENELVFGQESEDIEDMSSYREDEPNQLFSTHGNAEFEEQLLDAQREISTLKSQMVVAEEESEKAQNKLRALVEDLQDRLVRRQDDITHLEEDFQRTSSELDDIKAKLRTLEEEKAQLADDLDVANAKAHQLRKAEATVVAYKKKLDSVGIMNQQMTDLEDQAANYLRQIMELENEVKKSNALQKTVNELQEHITELEKHRSHTESSTKTSVSEIADLRSQLLAAENAKKQYERELNELRAQQETGEVAPPDISVPVPETQSKEQREKTMRLQIENKQMQEELAKLKEESSKYKEQAEAASAAAASVGVVSAVAYAAPAPGDATAAPPQELDREVRNLREQLAVKERENAKISGDKDKLEAYTKRTLAKFQDKYLVALQECKAKLKEKQDKIEILEQRSASERTAQKREERLLSSTIYELGLAIMQNRLKSGGS